MPDFNDNMYLAWGQRRARDISTNGIGGAKRTAHDLYERIGRLVSPPVNREAGLLIFERDWDLMIILDACRFDMMADVASDYNWLLTPERVRSAATGTKGWMRANFHSAHEDEMAETTYISASPWTETLCNPNDFNQLVEVWRHGYVDDLHVTPPRAVTDRAIRIGRESAADRYLVHYLQPHAPFLAHHERNTAFMDEYENSVWRAILRGRIDSEWVLDAYEQNLRDVLPEVKLLIDNFDADDVIITSDHGNAIGEWGLYGHGGPAIKPKTTVPWIETSANDQMTHESELSSNQESPSDEEQLKNLGYML